jgi:hypothetical protein
VWRSALAIGAVCSSLACRTAPTSASPPIIGAWGGDHILLTVTATASHAEFDCAQGDTSSPLRLDDRGAFNASGTFVRDRGGPIIVGQVPDSHPAIYFGSVTANTMTLTVQLTDTRDAIGTFTLVRDAPGRVVKCLLPLSGGIANQTLPR